MSSKIFGGVSRDADVIIAAMDCFAPFYAALGCTDQFHAVLDCAKRHKENLNACDEAEQKLVMCMKAAGCTMTDDTMITDDSSAACKKAVLKLVACLLIDNTVT